MSAQGRSGDVLAAAAAAAQGVRLWLVGGAVRDLALGRRCADVDIAVESDAATAARFVDRFSARIGFAPIVRHERFGTATLRAPDGARVDVAVTRRERYPEPGRLPEVELGASLREDLARRDVTIHAMARPIGAAGRLGPTRDPFGGRRDLARKTLRLLHEDSLRDDPTRAFRVARYAARLGFRPAAGFARALGRAGEAGSFERISGDRLRRALEEVLADERPALGVRVLVRYGVLDRVVPGWGESLRRERAKAADWGSLLAALSPEFRRRVADRLAFSRARRREFGVGR